MILIMYKSNSKTALSVSCVSFLRVNECFVLLNYIAVQNNIDKEGKYYIQFQMAKIYNTIQNTQYYNRSNGTSQINIGYSY